MLFILPPLQQQLMADAILPEVQLPKTLTIHVESSDGSRVSFKVNETSRFVKVFSAFCQARSITPGTVRFLYDGNRLHENQTPQDVGMEEDAQIDATMEQVGGCFAPSTCGSACAL